MTIPSADELALARASAHALWDRDLASRALGITLEKYVRLCPNGYDDRRYDGQRPCHGTRRDALHAGRFTFALACNSRNVPNVALQCSISFVGAVRLGDRVVAEAQECSLKGRTGVYDVSLARDGETVALFRGVCYRVSGTVIGELPE